MTAYILKRLLLFPARLFAVILVIFGVLNLAPTPQPTGADEANASQGAHTNEGYLLFKRQFNLDKPVFLNLRAWAATEEVRAWLRDAEGLDPGLPLGDRFSARERLDDYGNVLVPHLVTLLDDPDPEVRRLAVTRLPLAARLPLPAATSSQSSADMEARIMAFNADLQQWASPAEPEDLPVVLAQWKAWGEENRARYTPTTSDLAWGAVRDTRFGAYWASLLSLDLGVSALTHRPVLPEITSRIPASLTLAALSLSLAWVLSIPIGLYSAWRPNAPGDTALTVLVFFLYSMPLFFTGTVALVLFATGPDRWFPTGGLHSEDADQWSTLARLVDLAWHLVLPVGVYAAASLAALSRYTRAGVIEVMRADYIRTARAKGLSELAVVLKHAARNGLLPILTLLGAQLPLLVSGSVVIETIFNISGIGLYLYESIGRGDYNAVMGVLLVSALLTLIGLLLSDLAYAVADPRIRHA